MSDPWAAFPDAPAVPAAAVPAPPQVGDPWAQFPDAGGEHVLTIHGGVKPSGAQAGQPAPGDLGAQSAAQRGFISGVPILGPALLKAEDAIGSRIGAAISGQTPEQVSQQAQQVADTTDAAHPVAGALGSAAGSIAGTAPLIAAAPAAFGVGPGALTAGKVLAGAASGAGIGGLDAAVRSDGDVGSTALGTLGGAVGGAAGPVIGAGLTRAGESVADAIARSRALNGIGVSQPAADVLMRAAATDGTLGGQGAANIAAAGPNAMLADAGPGTQNVLDYAVNRGGPGGVAAGRAVQQRAAQAGRALDTTLDATLGPPEGIYTATNEIRDASAPARSAAYDAAYAQPIDYSSTKGRALESLMGRIPGSVIARANNLMRVEGEQSRQILARIADDGTATFERLPDVRQLDYITRALNDVAQRGDGQGALGGNTAEGRAYGNLSRAIRGQLRQAVPEYGTALDTAAEPIRARNALDFGRTLLSKAVPRDVAADEIGSMTVPEKQAARQGLRAAIAEARANVTKALTDPNLDAREAMATLKEFSSRAAQEKIAMLIGPKEQAALSEMLARTEKALQLRASLAQNSKTAIRHATDEIVKAATAPGPLGKLLAGEPVKAAKGVAQFVTHTRPQDIKAREDAIYSELADALTRLRGQQAIDFMTKLQGAHLTRANAASFIKSLPLKAGAQTGILSLLPALNERGKR